jgi:hypothetical protein
VSSSSYLRLSPRKPEADGGRPDRYSRDREREPVRGGREDSPRRTRDYEYVPAQYSLPQKRLIRPSSSVPTDPAEVVDLRPRLPREKRIPEPTDPSRRTTMLLPLEAICGTRRSSWIGRIMRDQVKQDCQKRKNAWMVVVTTQALCKTSDSHQAF